jgi:hypothetical protein
MTRFGGSGGVIFEFDPATNVFTKKKDMSTIGGFQRDHLLFLAMNFLLVRFIGIRYFPTTRRPIRIPFGRITTVLTPTAPIIH